MSDAFSNLLNGFAAAATPENLLFGLAGVILGTVVGVLPGLGPAVAISLLLPLTFGLDPLAAFIMFGGIYYGAMYGGATTAILVNTPGCASSAVTTFDGHPLARQGRAGAALSAAMIGSFVGGTFATFMLMLLAPTLIEVSLLFGPPEYFGLMLLALVLVASVGGSSVPKALFAMLLGLGIATIGIDLQTGVERMTFGFPELAGGVNVVLAGIGLFAIGEALWIASGGGKEAGDTLSVGSKVWMRSEEWVRSIYAWLRGTFLGFFVGVLPGAGGTMAALIGYGVEKNLSKTPEKFGTGVVEGVAAPEASNNAAAGGSLVPLLALGIPGSATTAVMLVAFQIYGLQPGPLLFEKSPELVWGLIASLYISNLLLVGINLPLVGLWAKLLKTPQGLLYSAVLVFSTLGAYSLKGSIGDVIIVYVLGVLAFVLRKFQFPIAPVLLGIVLGPMIEQEFRRSMAISAGDLSIFVSRPLALSFLILVVVALVVPFIRRLKAKPVMNPMSESD